MKVRHFYYISSGPRSKVLHMSASKIEGDSTYCGLTLHKPWHWERMRAPGVPVCKLCIERTP